MSSAARAGLAAALAFGLCLPSPGSAAQRPAGLRPTDASSPEAGLWDVMDRAEQQVRRSAELNTDPALNAYVRDVACKVAGDYCPELRVYVLDRPFFNATMAPNGYTEVWSGLLLRCGDEAELAYVLGHETSHFAESHSLQRHTSMKNRMAAATLISLGVAAAGAVAAASTDDPQAAQNISNATYGLVSVVYLASIAGYFKFSREQESEADLLGLRRSASAGYRPGGAIDSWRGMMAEAKASQFDRVRKQDARLGIFDTHPLTAERVALLEAEAAKLTPPNPVDGRDRYRVAIRPFLGAWLKDDLRRRDYGQTLFIIDRLARGGGDEGVLEFYRGETYRLRGEDGDLERARDAYRTASAHADAPATVWRELGEALRRTGRPAEARVSLETYLERAPQAEDAWLVRDTLQSLSKG